MPKPAENASTFQPGPVQNARKLADVYTDALFVPLDEIKGLRCLAAHARADFLPRLWDTVRIIYLLCEREYGRKFHLGSNDLYQALSLSHHWPALRIMSRLDVASEKNPGGTGVIERIWTGRPCRRAYNGEPLRHRNHVIKDKNGVPHKGGAYRDMASEYIFHGCRHLIKPMPSVASPPLPVRVHRPCVE